MCPHKKVCMLNRNYAVLKLYTYYMEVMPSQNYMHSIQKIFLHKIVCMPHRNYAMAKFFAYCMVWPRKIACMVHRKYALTKLYTRT